MAFRLISLSRRRVEGRGEAPDVGEFGGQAIALGVRNTDPISAAAPEAETAHAPEGVSGCGTTYFLPCDVSKRQPVQVAEHGVQKHSVA